MNKRFFRLCRCVPATFFVCRRIRLKIQSREREREREKLSSRESLKITDVSLKRNLFSDCCCKWSFNPCPASRFVSMPTFSELNGRVEYHHLGRAVAAAARSVGQSMSSIKTCGRSVGRSLIHNRDRERERKGGTGREGLLDLTECTRARCDGC